MARTNVIEVTCDELVVNATSRVFRQAYAETPVIPSTYDGKYVQLAAIATNAELTGAQMDALETAIEQITGIHKAFVLIGSARIPLDRVPDGNDLLITCQGGFDVRPSA